MEYAYNAIILKKRDIGETDRLYVLYTREAGKVLAMGRGVRKPQAKLAGHLETLNRGMVMVARSKGRGNITGAVAEWYGAELKSSSEAMIQVFDALKVFDRMVSGEECDPKLFDLVREYLEAVNAYSEVVLDEGSEKKRLTRQLLTQSFLFQVFSRLGYRLETQYSVVTGEALRADQRYGLSVAEGGMIEWEYAVAKRGIVPVGIDTIKLLRLFFSQKLSSLTKVQVRNETVAEAQASLDALTRWVAP